MADASLPLAPATPPDGAEATSAAHPRVDNGVVALRLRQIGALMASGLPRWEVVERAVAELGLTPSTAARYCQMVNRLWLRDAATDVQLRRGEARARVVDHLNRALAESAWTAIAKLNDSLCKIDGAYAPTEIKATVAPATQAAEQSAWATYLVDDMRTALLERGLSDDIASEVLRRVRQLGKARAAADEAQRAAEAADGGASEHALLEELAQLDAAGDEQGAGDGA